MCRYGQRYGFHDYHPSWEKAYQFSEINCHGCRSQAKNYTYNWIKENDYKPQPGDPKENFGMPGGVFTEDDFSIILDEVIERVECGNESAFTLNVFLFVICCRNLHVQWDWWGKEWFNNLFPQNAEVTCD